MKLNPRRRPATMADIERAKKAVFNDSVTYAAVIFLTVLVDKFNGADYIADVWREVNDLSDSISQGYVSMGDLRHTLGTEYDMKI